MTSLVCFALLTAVAAAQPPLRLPPSLDQLRQYNYQGPAQENPAEMPAPMVNPRPAVGNAPTENYIRQTSMQQQAPKARDVADVLSFDAPGPEKLFKLQSDAGLREWIRQDARSRNEGARVSFPKDPDLSDEIYQGRDWPSAAEIVEPYYVCYRRTPFEQKNFERYGWELGILQPAICAGKFYWDAFWLPYYMGTEPHRHYECNAGYCLPGDPVPLYLYPPNINATGAAAQTGALLGGFYFFP